MIKYTCIGAIRGKCKIMHLTLEASQECCLHDHKKCLNGNGKQSYSDRHPYMVKDGKVTFVDYDTEE